MWLRMVQSGLSLRLLPAHTISRFLSLLRLTLSTLGWVEIFKEMPMKKLFFLLSQEIDGDSFWLSIVGQGWQAALACGGRKFLRALVVFNKP